MADTSINWRFIATRFVWCLAVAWSIVFAGIYLAQRKLIYVPIADTSLPMDHGLPGVTASALSSADGERVGIWSRAAKPGKPTILYFHGQGGALSHYAFAYQRFLGEGWGLMAMTYRGYPGSTGTPSEAANVADAVAVYDALRARGVTASDIVVYGLSLGTGVATQVAAKRPVAGLVLESPYSSVTDVAAERFWYLPVRLAISDRYETTTHIRGVTAPVLVLHGAKDDVIPVKFGRRVADAVTGPKRYIEYADGQHDLFNHGAFNDVRAWLQEHHKPASRAD
jgi:uncharacterized protein